MRFTHLNAKFFSLEIIVDFESPHLLDGVFEYKLVVNSHLLQVLFKQALFSKEFHELSSLIRFNFTPVFCLRIIDFWIDESVVFIVEAYVVSFDQ